MQPPLPRHRRAAFTLIELLTVIAIIAVLAAILFPVIGNMKNRAHQSASVNNLRQWGAALAASLAEFDGAMPSDGASGGNANLSDEDAWFNRLPKFMGMQPLNSVQMQATPPRAGQKSLFVNPGVPVTSANANQTLFFYGMNDFLSTTAEPTMKMLRVERPAATVFMAEKSDPSSAVALPQVQAFFGGGNPMTDLDSEANFVFCDGHVATMKRRIFQNPLSTQSNPIDPNYTWLPFPEARQQ